MARVNIEICTDPSDIAFERDKSREFLDHWQALRNGGPVPRADAINPGTMKSLLPQIVIFELVDENTVRYRLAGTLATKRLGFEPRGLNLIDFTPPALRGEVRLAFDIAGRHNAGVLTHFTLVYGEEMPARLELVLLPLAAPEGQPPRVISLSTREPYPNTLHEPVVVQRPTNRIDDATVFDIGFGIPHALLDAYRG